MVIPLAMETANASMASAKAISIIVQMVIRGMLKKVLSDNKKKEFKGIRLWFLVHMGLSRTCEKNETLF